MSVVLWVGWVRARHARKIYTENAIPNGILMPP